MDKLTNRMASLLSAVVGGEYVPDWNDQAREVLAQLQALSQPPMSEDEYVKRDGSQCPFCGSASFMESDEIMREGSSASQRMECDACEAEWYDHYTLTGYTRGGDV